VVKERELCERQAAANAKLLREGEICLSLNQHAGREYGEVEVGTRDRQGQVQTARKNSLQKNAEHGAGA
jgi:hypothetical protein